MTESADIDLQLMRAMQHHEAGRLHEADDGYAQVLKLQPHHAQALRLRGILARNAGDIDQSIQWLTAAVNAGSASAAARAELGLSLMTAGRLQAAETQLRAARDRAPNALDVLTNLGALLQHRGHVREAVQLYREVVAQDSSEFEVRCNLSKALADAGELDAALQEAEAAVADANGNRGTLAALGAVLVDARRYPAAAEVLADAVRREPQDDMARVNLALCHAELDALPEAIRVLQAALSRNPHNARAAADLINYLSGAGDIGAALQLGEQFLAAHPGERLVVGSYAQALFDAGQTAQALEFCDCAQLVQELALEVPTGFGSADAFNAALREQLLGDPSLLNDPVGKATTGGAQTGELDLDGAAVLQGFGAAANAAVQTAIDEYRVRGLKNHALMEVAAPRWHLRAWGTLLRAGGKQSPHMHPLGWLSAVYYVDLPADLPAEHAEAGWLEFGRPPERYRRRIEPPTRRYEPAAGKLIVFPSWFWHRTLPFKSDAPRISIAFDVMPAGQHSEL